MQTTRYWSLTFLMGVILTKEKKEKKEEKKI